MYIRRKVFSLGEGNIDYDYNLYQALYSDYEDDYFDPTYDEIERFYSDSFDEGFDFYAQKMFGEFNEKAVYDKYYKQLRSQGVSKYDAEMQASKLMQEQKKKVGQRQTKFNTGTKTTEKLTFVPSDPSTGKGSRTIVSRKETPIIRQYDKTKHTDKLGEKQAGSILKLQEEKRNKNGYNAMKNQLLETLQNTKSESEGKIASLTDRATLAEGVLDATNRQNALERDAFNKRIASLNEDLGSAISERDEARRIGDEYGKKYANELGAHAQTLKEKKAIEEAAAEAAKQAKAKQEGLEKSLKRWKVGAGIGAGVAGLGGLGAYLYNRNKDR